MTDHRWIPRRATPLLVLASLALASTWAPWPGGVAAAPAQTTVDPDSLREGGGRGPAPTPIQDVLQRQGEAPSRFPLQFESEVVKLRVEEDSLRVEGIYRLRRRAEGMIPALFYPYPADSLLGGGRTVLLRVRTPEGSWAPLRWQESSRPAGARWLLPFFRGSVLELHTVYRQARSGCYARYIVTTTRAWREPLAHARFEIELPPGAEPLAFSHDFAREPGAPDGPYVFEAADFWPDRDITVTWRPPADAGPEEP